MATSKSLQTLFQRLGKLDQERRDILTTIHSSKEYLVKYIEDYVKVLVSSKKWYVLVGPKGETDTNNESHIISLVEANVNVNDGGFGKFDLWVHLKYKILGGGVTIRKHKISTKNELRPQIFQSMQELSATELKKLNKKIKEREAKEEKQKKIDALNADLKKLTDQIAKLQQEIQK